MPHTYTRQQIEQMSARSIVQTRQERLFVEGAERAMLPSFSDLKRGAKFYTVSVHNFQGRAHLIANNDFSIAGSFDSFVSQRTQNIELLAAKYGLTFTEEHHAEYAGRNLKSEQIEMATEAIYNRQDDLGYYGEAGLNLYGFTNQPNVHQFTLPADGGGGSAFWDDKTPEQILRDMQQIVYSASRRTRWAYHTTHLAIPPEIWEVLAFTILSGLNSTSTILSAFLTNQQVLGGGHGKVEIVLAPGLSNAGPAGTPMMVAYNPSERHIGILETPGIDSRPVKESVTGWDGLFYKYVGGIALLQPLSMTYVQGVLNPANL
jgi:hypothetical protein